MTEALLFVSVGSLLLTGTATLVIAALTLHSARRYVELAELRMESLREEQARLLMFLHEECQGSKEETIQTPEQHLEARRWAEQWSLTREQGQRLQTRRGLLRTPRDVERRIEELKRELQELRGVQQGREVERNRDRKSVV